VLLDYYFLDPRVALVPTEHLSANGVDPAFAEVLSERLGWSGRRVELLGAAFALYWRRATALAGIAGLRPPRRRSIAVVRGGAELRPYAPLLNTSTWTVYESDLDPERSHAELIAYALVRGDRMAETGEVTRAALDLAVYWIGRNDAETRAFTAAARASESPEGPEFRLVADALPWLRELRHEKLRPPRVGQHRAIPGTGLLVPRRHESRPDELVERGRARAHEAVARFHARFRTPGGPALRRLAEWLADESPPLLVTAAHGRIVWDPVSPGRSELLAEALAEAPAEAVEDVALDLARIAAHTARFRAALADPSALPAPDAAVAQRGYAYLHRERGEIAYDLDEPGIERRRCPALPYAREMVGARTWHEWAHLAVDGGAVPRTAGDRRWEELERAFAAVLDEVVQRAPRAVKAATASDLERLTGPGSAGARLVRLFETRLPDYRANLLACRFMTLPERETYVRQNVRALSREYAADQLWRRLVRLLYEAQYLTFSAIADRRAYLLDTTWLRDDYLVTRLLGERDLDALLEAAGTLCEAHAVEAARFVAGALPPAAWPNP
jgi:hypothetical protein